MPYKPRFSYFISPLETPVSQNSDIWLQPLPLSRHCSGEKSEISLGHGEYFQAIRNFFENDGNEIVCRALTRRLQQDVKARYVASMRGPTVKLLVRSRHGDAALQEKTVGLIKDLNQRGIRLEACGYALDLFAIEPEDLYQGIVTVGNSLNSLIGYQTKGYSLVSMN